MPRFEKQKDLRAAQKLGFCYLCGIKFNDTDKPTREHLPPSSLFRKEDRDFPLILPAHVECNEREHKSDELLGLLIAQIEGWPIPPRHRQLDADLIPTEQGMFTVSRDLDLNRFITRCVRGFHAALYGDWLPPDTENVLHPPFRGGHLNPDTGSPYDNVQARLLVDALLDQHAVFVQILKKNRLAGRTDKVATRNGKCIYECVWAKSDNGRTTCVFGLKINNWHRLGALAGYTPRGCVGMYAPKTGRPQNSTSETNLEVVFKNRDPLDPFGD